MKFIVKQNKRKAVSPVIATLLLIAIAVAAAIIVYAFVTGLIGGLSHGASSTLITVTPSLAVPTSGAGTVALTIQNNANNPITGIVVQFPSGISDGNNNLCMGQTAAGDYCGTAVAVPAACPALSAKPVVFCNGTPDTISTATPLAVGQEVSASVGLIPAAVGPVPLESGTTYVFTVTVTFSDGSTSVDPVSVTAQL
ncbi:MAG: archaellin/type IV pilin N-terminal domain-containing protein [Nitrososphaerales archaeon]|jgi:flagellin-like protein